MSRVTKALILCAAIGLVFGVLIRMASAQLKASDITVLSKETELHEGETYKVIRWKNFSYRAFEDIKNVAFYNCNFTQREPNTEIFKPQTFFLLPVPGTHCENLKFVDCNLRNVKLKGITGMYRYGGNNVQLRFTFAGFDTLWQRTPVTRTAWVDGQEREVVYLDTTGYALGDSTFNVEVVK